MIARARAQLAARFHTHTTLTHDAQHTMLNTQINHTSRPATTSVRLHVRGLQRRVCRCGPCHEGVASNLSGLWRRATRWVRFSCRPAPCAPTQPRTPAHPRLPPPSLQPSSQHPNNRKPPNQPTTGYNSVCGALKKLDEGLGCALFSPPPHCRICVRHARVRAAARVHVHAPPPPPPLLLLLPHLPCTHTLTHNHARTELALSLMTQEEPTTTPLLLPIYTHKKKTSHSYLATFFKQMRIPQEFVHGASGRGEEGEGRRRSRQGPLLEVEVGIVAAAAVAAAAVAPN